LKGLVKTGVGTILVEIVRDLFHGATTQIRTDEGYTDPIKVKRGIERGDPLSGLLFNIAIDVIIS